MKPENSDPELVKNLWGQMVKPPKDVRGRKSYGKTKENQELVADLAGFGITQGDICTVLGCDEKTLRKYYSRELKEGALMLEVEMIELLVTKARQGNISAIREVREMVAAHAAPKALPVHKSRPRLLGKKDQLQQEAEIPSGSWNDVLHLS